MILKVIFLGNGRTIRGAKGHMPFPGHRTQEEVRQDEARKQMNIKQGHLKRLAKREAQG